MKDLIPVPSKGTPLRASWGAAVANGMNAFASMSYPGMLSREGMTGTGAQPLPSNRRDRKAHSDPWTFGCTEDNEENRTGGWYRQIVQIGLTIYNFETPGEGFNDETQCADGDHYLKVDLNNEEKNRISIVRTEKDAGDSFSDIQNGILAFYIGTVENGIQTRGVHWPPVVYNYL